MKPTAADPAPDGESSCSSTLREFRAVLATVTDTLDRGEAMQSSTAPLAAFIQQRVGCSTVTFWSLSRRDGHAVVSRIGGYDADADAALLEPLVRPAAEFNMKELVKTGIRIVALPTTPDRAVGSLADDTLFPACVDATIAANGQTFGLIRCVFRAPHRSWRMAETTLLRSFAGEIALRRARRNMLWS